MLMGGRAREAKIHYLDGTFRMLSAGDHVRCAITGAITPADLEEMIGYEGETAAEAMSAVGLDHTRVAEAQRNSRLRAAT